MHSHFRLSSNITFLVVIGIVVVSVIFGSNRLLSHGNGQDLTFSLPSATPQGNNIIEQENALQGTEGWKIPPGQGATTQIQAYSSETSVAPGQTITFYVSTQVEGTPYSIGIYRLGWYGGYGGRLEFLQSNLTGHAQGYYDVKNAKLVNCTSCRINDSLGLIEANWRPSYTLTISSNWVTGAYLAKFADAKGMQTYAPFDVRGNYHSTYVVVTSDTTYQAYNNWGGISLYEDDTNGNASGSISEGNNLARGVKVSFDRPYAEGYGSGNLLHFDGETIHWLERQGYDLSYMSSVDLHEHPQILLQHRVYLSLGHDEYWTKEMHDGVAAARDHGVSLAFLGADAIYWQMRFESDSAGAPDRTIVCYKVETFRGGNTSDLTRDPFYRKDNSRLTSQWRDPVLNEPENAIIGIMYSGLTHKQNGYPWQVSSSSKSLLLDGTGLVPGQQYGCGVVGYEWDHIFNNGATPAGLQVLAQSQTVSNANQPDFSDTTYYVASSGAIVFATGSIYWTSVLDDYRFTQDPLCANQPLTVSNMQKLMVNVMEALATHHLSPSTPSK